MVELAHYVAAGKLREDATAAIYRGHRSSDHAPVLIKVLRHEPPSPRDIARLRLEHAVTTELDLPGVVRAVGLERCGSGVALVLEDPGGRLLAELIAEGRIDLTAALRIADSVAGTLAAIHRLGMVHRDLHPPASVTRMARDFREVRSRRSLG